MQYLLSEEEMAGLRQGVRERHQMPSLEVLSAAVKELACKLPQEGRDRPHGCIHVDRQQTWYCSGCPVEIICPLPKEWSK